MTQNITQPLQFKSHIARLEMLMGANYILIPPVILNQLGGAGKGRYICTVNNKLQFQCGIMPLKKGSGYITINKKRLAEASLKTGDKVEITLELDNSKYGMKMPDELSELLKQDKEADQRFHALTPGKQRTIIYYILNVKRSQSRIDRAIMMMNNLKSLPKGKENMRGLLGLDL